MEEWTMTLDGETLSPVEIEAIHFGLIMLRAHLNYGHIAGDIDIETVRELIHKMTFGKG